MPKYTEKIDTYTLPVAALDGTVIFPGIPISLELSSEGAIRACEKASGESGRAFFSLRNVSDEEAVRSALSDGDSDSEEIEDDICEIGCVGTIKQFVRFRENSARVVVEGVCRASLLSAETDEDGIPVAAVLGKTVEVDSHNDTAIEAIMREVRGSFDEFVSRMPKVSPELALSVHSITSPGLLCDFIASGVLMDVHDKQTVLEQYDPVVRLTTLAVILARETEVVKTEADIRQKVQSNIDRGQREYYLREQLKVIYAELGEGRDSEAAGGLYDEDDDEIAEYMNKIRDAALPEEVEAKLIKETKKLAKTPFNSAEAGVLRNYLDVCLELPWNKRTEDRVDVELAHRILDRDHNGLEKVKERILEYLAVKQLNSELRHQIICLVGPPGTGKTSIARSVAEAMNRNFVRVSLGGVRDEADIRGHRKTYVGSMPGRIVGALTQAQVMNPLILLDEIDKLTSDAHGDPSSALLEVLDGEQNKAFRDHFVELPIDLSSCVFIATANTLETIPAPLFDRMEVIELRSYSRHEKLAIAKDHLIPKQRARHGLTTKQLRINDSAVTELIDFYTAEAGVRSLERQIAALCRKAAKRIVEAERSGEELGCISIKAKNIAGYLGPRKLLPETIRDNDDVGEVNGLAYTEVGGDLLHIEAVAVPGTGKLELTGSLGDVMKESAQAAITYIRAHASELSVEPDFYKKKDIHIHVPEGAVPKDGPSAGVTIATALASELSGRAVRRDVAMTGEITLHGKVLPIGGLREKAMAAYKTGVKTVLIPRSNLRDLEEIDPVVREKLNFIPCSRVSEVFGEALI